MSRIEIGMAVLTITCTVRARIHHRLEARSDSQTGTQREP